MNRKIASVAINPAMQIIVTITRTMSSPFHPSACPNQ
jgi:hypothetical protein